jgi:hypothetical protein
MKSTPDSNPSSQRLCKFCWEDNPAKAYAVADRPSRAFCIDLSLMQWRSRPLIYKKKGSSVPLQVRLSPPAPPQLHLIPDFLSGSAFLPRFAAFLDLAESPALAPRHNVSQVWTLFRHGNIKTDCFSSWVMLHDQEGFVRLPNERLIYSSPPRTSVSLTPPSGYKGTEKLSVQSSAGCIHLTNQRVSIIHLSIVGFSQLLTRSSISPQTEQMTSSPSPHPF